MDAIVPALAIKQTLGMNNEKQVSEMQQRLIWVDLEMTGLNPDSDSILEIATIVTDANLVELAQGPFYAIRRSEIELKAMDDWNRSHHSDSGLWNRVLESRVEIRSAEQETLKFLRQWTEQGTSPMCGNSICQDRRFMHRLMPELKDWFHYRNLDVSTIKELAARWAPQLLEGFTKQNRHEALSDIRESIEELRYYRSHMGELSDRQ
jgi:oligoribonuclease